MSRAAMKLRAIFFDFDGVIMDSMHLKLDGYCLAMAPYGFARDDVNRLMRRHMGQSRRRIIRFMHAELAGSEMPDGEFERALRVFNEHDDASRADMQPIPGSFEFLERVHQSYFTAVVTGTPEDFILRTTAHHDLDRYFDIVRGSPDTKRDILADLLAANGLSPAESLFIGDGRTDQEAADHHGMRFVGLDNGDASFNPDTAWRVVRDLNELSDVVSDDRD
jgi:phosphoglycolate phosphatase-like HAD superfamily hydrolase